VDTAGGADCRRLADDFRAAVVFVVVSLLLKAGFPRPGCAGGEDGRRSAETECSEVLVVDGDRPASMVVLK